MEVTKAQSRIVPLLAMSMSVCIVIASGGCVVIHPARSGIVPLRALCSPMKDARPSAACVEKTIQRRSGIVGFPARFWSMGNPSRLAGFAGLMILEPSCVARDPERSVAEGNPDGLEGSAAVIPVPSFKAALQIVYLEGGVGWAVLGGGAE